MALIICTECGKKVSDRAKECNDCGFPISEFVEESAGQVRISFPSKATTALGKLEEATQHCKVFDESGEEMARIKRGKFFTFQCPAPTTISAKVTMTISGDIPKQTINPGDNYEVKISMLGRASLVKVDYLIQ